MFPIIIKYSKTLSGDFDTIANQKILDCAKEYLKRDGVDHIDIIDESVLKFNNDFFAIRPGLNWNIWVGIWRGQISIEKLDSKRKIRYRINTIRFWIIGLLTGLLFGLITKLLWVGLLAFGVMGLLNWTISVVRHYFNLTGLLTDIIIEKEKDKNR